MYNKNKKVYVYLTSITFDIMLFNVVTGGGISFVSKNYIKIIDFSYIT